MKILQLIYESPESPFGYGGAGVRAYEIYRRLSDRDDITLLSMRFPGALDKERDGFRVLYAGTESESLVKSVLAYTVKAAGYIRKHGDAYDIIVENFLPSTPFFTRFLTKRPVILQVQGVMERSATRNINRAGIGKIPLKKNSPLYSLPMAFVESFYPGLYDSFLFVSDVTEKKVLSRIRRRIRFSSVIPNGISDDLLRTEMQDGSYVLFFSRLDVYQKGIDILIAAFEKISKGFPGVGLVLAGYEFDKFEGLVSRLSPSLRKKIEYAGFVTGEKKRDLLSKAKLFVLPSRYESLPISIFEAAACGKPVLVSDIPEMNFVEENGFGLSFPSGSVDGLAERMKILLTDGQMRAAMGKRGREYASRFLWDDIALQFEDVVKRASKVCCT
jgi:glycogen(starch) synthase